MSNNILIRRSYSADYTNTSIPENMSNTYAERVANILVSPTTLSNETISDNVVRSFNINTRGWNLTLQANDEGILGFTPNDESRPRKDSGYKFEKSVLFLNNLEPYYMVVFRRNWNANIVFIRINYDENRIMVTGNYRNQSNTSQTYGMSFDIIKDPNNPTEYIIENILFRTSALFTDNLYTEIGIKHYNRDKDYWEPQRLKNQVVNNIRYIDPFEHSLNVQYYDGTYYDLEIQNIQIANKNYIEYNTKKYDSVHNKIFKYTTPKHVKFDYPNGINLNNELKKYYITVFREGLESDVLLNLYNIREEINTGVYLKDNKPYTTSKSLLESNYIVTDKYGYKKIINLNDPPMTQGYIYGNVVLTKCNIPEDKLRIDCYRVDGQFIGSYPVKNNSYDIPNLNIHDQYNIMLIDESKTIEWRVSSNRKPEKYETAIEYKVFPINDINVYNYNNEIIITWEIDKIDELYRIDKFKLYYSNEFIDESNISKTNYIVVDGLSYNLTYNDRDKYNYYMIESQYKNLYNRSACINNNKNNNETITLEGIFNVDS